MPTYCFRQNGAEDCRNFGNQPIYGKQEQKEALPQAEKIFEIISYFFKKCASNPLTFRLKGDGVIFCPSELWKFHIQQ